MYIFRASITTKIYAKDYGKRAFRISIGIKQSKKIVPVKSYVKKDGTKVGGHRRSTPN